MDIIYSNNPTADEYAALRASAGWRVLTPRQLEAAVKNNVFAIVARQDDSAVGIARIIGDGGYEFFITDVIVLPEFQGKGIGKRMMTEVMNYVGSSGGEGESLFVNLMASKGKERFYEGFGFKMRPNDDCGAGMTQFIAK